MQKPSLNPVLAQMFEGMQWLPLIGIGMATIITLGFVGIAFFILRKHVRNRRTSLALSAVFGITPIVGFLIWSTHFNSPLRLPSGAREVKISRSFPFALGIEDYLRFRLSETEFRSWIANLCGQTWQSVESGAAEIQFEAFTNGHYTIMTPRGAGQSLKGEAYSPPWGSDTLTWMDIRNVKSGYRIQQWRAFPGQILYDSDTELVYYRFWD